MDTINLILKLESELTNKEIQEVEKIIKRTGYCEIVRILERNEFDIVLSYPKYFSETNAFLVNDSRECFEVQENFVKLLKNNLLTYNLKIRIVGVTVPFIYLMDSKEDIYYYKNIFKILEEVYENKNSNFGSERNVIINRKYGEFIFSDRSYDREYYQKVTISSQFESLKSKYDSNTFKNIYDEFPDLKKRMKFEYYLKISKSRGLGKIMTLNEFKNFNIFEIFIEKASDYILENLLNEEKIEKVFDYKIEELTDKFYEERNRKKLNYENFFYKYINLIVDYQVIRKTLKQIRNPKTQEGAITNIRRLIFRTEEKEKIIIFDTYEKIKNMIRFFKKFR